jgi:flavin-dependent dehydrogenase
MMNVGLGTITEMGAGLKEHFLRFLDRTGFSDLDSSNIMAATIPTALLPRLWLPRVLFVGDAGGFANALTGGGLCTGIESGEHAAATAREAVAANDFSGTTLSAFERRCTAARRMLNLRTTALYYLTGAVKRGLDRPFAVKMLIRSMLPSVN